MLTEAQMTTIKAARTLTREHTQKCSDATHKEYIFFMHSRAKKLGIKDALGWYKADKKRTAYKIKAAAKVYVIDGLKELLYEQDKIQKAKETETEKFKKIVQKIDFILSLSKDHGIFSDIEIDKDAKNKDIEKSHYTLYHEKHKEKKKPL